MQPRQFIAGKRRKFCKKQAGGRGNRGARAAAVNTERRADALTEANAEEAALIVEQGITSADVHQLDPQRVENLVAE